MKSQGTQAVKDKSTPDSREDEAYHLLSEWLDEPEFEGSLDPEVHAEVRSVCREVFDKYKPNSHASSKQLEKDVIKQFGRWLHRYKNRTRLKRAVINLLIRAGKDITDETDIGEM